MIQIGGLQKVTLIDFPGRLAATVFLCGCNFRCPFCYSSELVVPERIKLQPKISEKEFFSFLKERQGLLEGVVVCGGEPTLNKDLPEFILQIKKLGYLVKLDTNGSNPELLQELVEKKLVDYIAMDIKAPFDIKKYQKNTASEADLKNIIKSTELIKNSGLDYEFRTTVVPGFHLKEDILKIARDISPAKKYYLQGFRPEKTIDKKLEKTKPYDQDFLLEIQKAISPFFEVCQVR